MGQGNVKKDIRALGRARKMNNQILSDKFSIRLGATPRSCTGGKVNTFSAFSLLMLSDANRFDAQPPSSQE